MQLKYLTLIVSAMLLFATAACNKTKTTMTTENNNPLFPKGNQLPAEWFTGNAFLHPLIGPDKNNEFSAGNVTFAPGARTNWHTHPKGQVLIVINGIGWYQEEGEIARSIKKGDVVNIPENIKHWHGASADMEMSHIAITNFKDGIPVTWLEPVSDQDYKNVIKQ
jgi:quercetin dioxygenase-like cupin family protein